MWFVPSNLAPFHHLFEKLLMDFSLSCHCSLGKVGTRVNNFGGGCFPGQKLLRFLTEKEGGNEGPSNFLCSLVAFKAVGPKFMKLLGKKGALIKGKTLSFAATYKSSFKSF